MEVSTHTHRKGEIMWQHKLRSQVVSPQTWCRHQSIIRVTTRLLNVGGVFGDHNCTFTQSKPDLAWLEVLRQRLTDFQQWHSNDFQFKYQCSMFLNKHIHTHSQQVATFPESVSLLISLHVHTVHIHARLRICLSHIRYCTDTHDMMLLHTRLWFVWIECIHC